MLALKEPICTTLNSISNWSLYLSSSSETHTKQNHQLLWRGMTISSRGGEGGAGVLHYLFLKFSNKIKKILHWSCIINYDFFPLCTNVEYSPETWSQINWVDCLYVKQWALKDFAHGLEIVLKSCSELRQGNFLWEKVQSWLSASILDL